MKFPILLIIISFLTQISFAQTNNLTITCPENTFLGTVDECLNFAPDAPNQIEEVTAPPYNILIEGDIPERLRVTSRDDNTIFVCEEDARIVNREVIIFEDTNINFAYDVGEEVRICNYTIETELYITVPEFISPPDVILDCGANTGPEITGDVTAIQFECTSISDGVEVRFSDIETVDGNITTIQRTWTATNFCDIKYEQTQTITISCETENDYTITCPENTFLGVFSCKDIDEIPPLINSIEEAMAPPYNIQIEGDLPPSTGVYSEDDGTIFFCENDPRLVTREIIFCAGYFGCGGFEPYEILAHCSFTIETIPDTIPIEFTPPADYVIDCNNKEIVDDAVTFLGEDCFDVNQSNAFFSENEKFVEDTIFFIRKWITKDICSNYSERKEQIITYSCPPTITDITVNCPENTFLGIYDCSNIDDVPDLAGNIEEAIAPPYNIQIEGEITPDLRVSSDDDASIFICESDARKVNRSIVIYRDLNLNFVWDLGEEIGWCSYTIETIPDITPLEITIPSDIELVCGLDPFDLINTGFLWIEDDTECDFLSGDPTIYEDEVIINENITTILRTWSASDPCGNISTPQVQTITVDCSDTTDARIICPENTFLGAFSCTDELPKRPFSIQSAMVPPYNIQIEGRVPERVRFTSKDDNDIFFCEEDARIVNRQVIIYEDTMRNLRYDVGEEIGICTYTIETIPDVTPIGFIAPPDIEMDCFDNPGTPDGSPIAIIGDDCFPLNEDLAFFTDEIIEVGNDLEIIRTWNTVDPCGNLSEPQEQIIRLKNCSTTITCPENTFLGAFGCESINEIPPPINTIEEVMAPPYNIQIEGELPENAKAISEDDGVIFFCESDPRVVTREIIIYTGYGGFEPTEELARCSFTFETIADISIPQFTVPPDIEILCDDDRSPENTGDVFVVEVNCQMENDGLELFFEDTETIQGDGTIINRTWIASNACGERSTQLQTITINCEPVCTPPKVGILECGN